MAERPEPDRPMRIVSLDYCADQYVLRFVDPERILAVSPEAGASYSYMRAAAEGLPQVRPTAEDVLVLRPDLIVRSYGGGPQAAAFFERAGIEVLDVGWAGDIEAVMANVERMASALGAAEAGRAVSADMRARLDALEAGASGESVLYMTPGGATTGPGSLVHDMLELAGLQNFVAEPGWHALPLERLAYEQPAHVAAARFHSPGQGPGRWSPARHPLARAQLERDDAIDLDGAWTACGGWFLIEAVEALAEGAGK